MTTWQYGELRVTYQEGGAATGTWNDGAGGAAQFDGLLHLTRLNELGGEGWDLVGTHQDRWAVDLQEPEPYAVASYVPQPRLVQHYRSVTYTLKRPAE
ncbi:hypothetical protein ACIQU5_31950 [Streptomyces sp. NPDC090306]|uniref:hypothetical protein n=1 Tax=Streptomyces sp. NPDC090306 TaxID=3365961 RepID=UPI0037FD9DB5